MTLVYEFRPVNVAQLPLDDIWWPHDERWNRKNRNMGSTELEGLCG